MSYSFHTGVINNHNLLTIIGIRTILEQVYTSDMILKCSNILFLMQKTGQCASGNLIIILPTQTCLWKGI